MKGLPARIEVFDNQKAATKGKPPLFQILFKNVINIVTSEVQGKPRAFITLQEEDSFTFSSCNTGHNRWELIDYCKLVSKLPEHVIPEIPKRCLVSQQQIEQYGDCRRYSGGTYVHTKSVCNDFILTFNIQLAVGWCTSSMKELDQL